MKTVRLPFSRFLNEETVLYLFLMLLALGLRLYALGVRPIHYDEALHALYSWKLTMGQGYQHDPMMHGPFKFAATALVFRLIGDSDFTARLLPALAGTAIVGLPYLLRRELGRTGALFTSALLAFSPSLLYFSRFIRDDIFMTLWALLLAVCIVGYLREAKSRYLYIAALVLSLSFATMEVTYFYLALFLVFLLALSYKELWQAVRQGFRFSALSPAPALFLLLLTLSLPFFAPGLSLFQNWLGVTLSNRNSSLGPEGTPLGAGYAVAAAALFLSFVVASLIGLRWNPGRWLRCFALFYGVYILLYSTFFTNFKGLGTGVWGSFSYWLVQHGKGRIEQPLYYYPFLLSIYEFLPLLLALGAALYYARRRRRQSGFPVVPFLFFWAGGIFLLFSYAGEKVPWLLVHLTLPLVLIAGKWGGEMAEGLWSWGHRAGTALFLLLFLFWALVSFQASYSRDDKPVEALVYAQSSFDVARARGDLEGLLRQGGTVLVDPDLAAAWQWYLRGYRQVQFTDFSSSEPTPGSAAIIDGSRLARLDPFRDRFGPPQEYQLLLWFPESYRQWHWRDWLTGKAERGWGRYFLFRDSPPYWARTGHILLPNPTAGTGK